jgi:hypothetical protein
MLFSAVSNKSPVELELNGSFTQKGWEQRPLESASNWQLSRQALQLSQSTSLSYADMLLYATLHDKEDSSIEAWRLLK